MAYDSPKSVEYMRVSMKLGILCFTEITLMIPNLQEKICPKI